MFGTFVNRQDSPTGPIPGEPQNFDLALRIHSNNGSRLATLHFLPRLSGSFNDVLRIYVGFNDLLRKGDTNSGGD